MSPVRESISKGTVTPVRDVPSSIPRPEYVGKTRAALWTGGDVHSPETIERIRVSARIAAQALAEVGRHVVPGVTTDELDRIGHEFVLDHGAYPSTLGYPGAAGRPAFPKALCTSVNEVICHGIPDSTVIEEGDIVKVDITAFTGGVHGDNCGSFIAGEGTPEAQELVQVTYDAMMRGIKAAQPGREVNIIGRVIEKYASRFGFESVRSYTGHGVGPAFHTGLVIPHYDAAPHHADVIEPGMVFTVEPMLCMGSEENHEWDDGWTVVTDDHSWVAQFEHTIVITETGPEILTLP
ncbi:type I methionyl aminopeptidase [Demequina sp. SYSU T00039]|uniref:Methionine aminopeptidase n=1 Tax=Demequina lignilytica TaxID=3051663 RepID=A0AAW7M0Y2_9MICO|nr:MULTISPECIES: type I methionyl aminopeptidase [unclassified Demequina]MDN4486899.1 type I methionyl aminopeptidase [Demequina sp. SYSU T00039]MDN4489583.1 type I methionyl aminopeptidase [Demequina sp. SYSU T00068]